MPQYNFKESEKKWQEYWEKNNIFKFNPKNKNSIYSIDTPPPTVSGKMHIGHAFSYSQQDFIARYHRMKQENVFYPFGTDNNGLPTERLIEKIKNIRSVDMQRQEFIDLCNTTLKEIIPDFVQDWKNIGMSCDFTNIYSTIDKHCIKTAQKSFIELYKKELVYQKEEPSMWCVSCRTAIAQAELEDKQLSSTFNDITFKLENGEKITIATTRPELLPACVCIFVNPNDKRYKNLVGKKVIVPLFNQKVSVFADESADPEKGTGILMICSYGDKYDVEAIKKRKLEPRICINKEGRLNKLAGKYENLTIVEARKQILEDLESQGLLTNKKQITHNVNVHDRCGTEIEFLTTKQWFIKILDNKKKFLEAGKKLKWYPETMRTRYEHWINGLQWDWCISRQRHFGVPFPVWYCNKCNNIIIAEESELPLDPLRDNPKKKCKCGSNLFTGEKDVMDTWNTSSLSPQIITNWIKDKNYNTNIEMYPCSLRPQAHDIIRTWLFYTLIKGIYHQNKNPWKDVMISGHVLDPKGESMHKSKGNAIEPTQVLEKYGADALRFWSSGSKLGEDLRYLEKDLVTGQKMVTKLWNASSFTLSHLNDFENKKPKLELIDQWLLIKLNELVKECTELFDNYEYSAVKSKVEQFFWHTFCDYYLEIVKDRLYNPDRRGKEQRKSAQYVLYNSLLTIIKLIAPIMPYITEEIYQSYFNKKEKCISIHISEWPKYNKELKDKKLEKIGDEFIEVLTKVRQFKTENNKSMKEPVNIILKGNNLKDLVEDLKAVTSAANITFGKEFKVSF
ncbi:MAG: valine--tRNA ligase [Candidatus Nanoarchaeia archaeon]|nr:valine--tRNA ligase [Candidatus Nanoarchaeia archaeon]